MFASPQFNTATGYNGAQPTIAFWFNSLEQRGSEKFVKLTWTYSGPITYVQMRYSVNNGSGFGAVQSYPNVNEAAGSGFYIGGYGPGTKKISVQIYAANCYYKLAEGSTVNAAPFAMPAGNSSGIIDLWP